MIISERESFLNFRCLNRVKINLYLTDNLVILWIFFTVLKIIVLIFRILKLSMNMKYI